MATMNISLVLFSSSPINHCNAELKSQPKSPAMTSDFVTVTAKYNIYYALSTGKTSDSTTNNIGVVPYFYTNVTLPKKNTFENNQRKTWFEFYYLNYYMLEYTAR